MLGTGLLRCGSFETVDAPTTGEEIKDGDAVMEALVLFLWKCSYQQDSF